MTLLFWWPDGPIFCANPPDQPLHSELPDKKEEKENWENRKRLLPLTWVYWSLTTRRVSRKMLSSGIWGDLLSFWRRQWHPTPVLLPGKSYGWRSLVGCSPWGRKELDTTERLHFQFSLSCIGEGNGNPLQCSCPENPRDGGAWWAVVFGVAQSQTWLKRLSSSSTISFTSCSKSWKS